MTINTTYQHKREIYVVITHACNLRCKYCYYDKGYDATHPAIERLKDVLEVEYSTKHENIEVAFHGGEPFLEWDAIREIAEWTWATYPNIIFRATTNGTVLTDRIKDWLRIHRKSFIVTLSIDGLRDIHNKYRCNSYDLIDRPFFRDVFPTVGVKMTVSPGGLSKMYEGFCSLSDEGFYVNPSLAREAEWEPKTDVPIFREQLDRLANWYLVHPNIPPAELLGINFVEQPVSDGESHKCSCGAGRTIVAYDYDGTKYPCHSFINFCRKPSKSELDSLFATLSKNSADALHSPCAKCFLSPWCAPCYGLSWVVRGDMGRLDPVMCEFASETVCVAAKLQAEMLVSDAKYLFMERKTDNERACIARTVMTILQNLDAKERR